MVLFPQQCVAETYLVDLLCQVDLVWSCLWKELDPVFFWISFYSIAVNQLAKKFDTGYVEHILTSFTDMQMPIQAFGRLKYHQNLLHSFFSTISTT